MNNVQLLANGQAQDKPVAESLEEFKMGISAGINLLCGDDENKVKELLGDNAKFFINTGNIQEQASAQTLLDIAFKVNMVLSQYCNESVLEGKTIEEFGTELNDAYAKAYGYTNSKDIVNEYIKSQQEGVQNVKTGFQIVGTAVVIAGQIVPVGGQVAAAMLWGGTAFSALGSAGVSLTEGLTQKGGLKEEELYQIIKELGTTIALVSSGIGIGKMSSAAFSALVAKNCPLFAAWAAEVGIDVAASLAADLVITGEINLAGEGWAQLQALLIGLLKSKGNLRTYIATHTGQIPNNKFELYETKMDMEALSNIPAGKTVKISVAGDGYHIDKYKINKNGQKVLHATNGAEITLDSFNRPISSRRFGATSFYHYSNNNSNKPSLIERFDNKNIVMKIEMDDNFVTTTNYAMGYESKTDLIKGCGVSFRELDFLDYPTNIGKNSGYYKKIATELDNCKNFDEVDNYKLEFASKYANRIPEEMIINRKYEIITEDLKICKTIDELNIKTEKYKNITFDNKQEIIDKQFKHILFTEINTCKSLEEINVMKNKFKSQNFEIPEDVISKKLLSMLSDEITNISSLKDLEGLKARYNIQGFEIPENIYKYYENKIINPNVSNTELAIKSGNNSSRSRFSKPDFDPKDPKYKDNLPKVCRELASRIEYENAVLSPEHISDITKNLSKKTGMREKDILEVMSRLTQFGNMKSLEDLEVRLRNLGIREICDEPGVSNNATLNYFTNKEQISLLRSSAASQAFILDDASLKYLENLNETDRNLFLDEINTGSIKLIELDGTAVKIGDKYYSYTMMDGGQNLEAMTEAVLNQIRSGKTFDEVVQGDLRSRLDKVFGTGFSDKNVNNINIQKDATPQNIAKQIRPNIPDAEYIETVISTIVKNTKELSQKETTIAKSVIAKYYDYMTKIYTSDSMSEVLKLKHQEIEKQVLKLGKTMDDVVYVYPSTGKSYSIVNQLYTKINGIDTDKFKFYTDYINAPNTNLENKVLVLLDDVVGSGESMLASGDLRYNFALKQNPNCNIIFAPITACENGIVRITTKIKDSGREGMDFILYDKDNVSQFDKFTSMLEPEELNVLEKIMENKGHDQNALVTSFQYMIPDNNSNIAGYLNMINLNNNCSYAANKSGTANTEDEIAKLIRRYILERMYSDGL